MIFFSIFPDETYQAKGGGGETAEFRNIENNLSPTSPLHLHPDNT